MSWFLPLMSRPRMSRLDCLVVVAIIGVLVALLMPAGDHDRTHRYPPARANVGSPLADVAGEYGQRTGRGGGWELSILSDGRYSRFQSCCVGILERESGYVHLLAGHYLLLPAGNSPTSPRIERDFLPIRWKERLYLVPPDRMQEFCYAVTEGEEPRAGGEMGERFLLRSPAPRVDGVPDLPEPWAAFLKQNLVLGKIVEVIDEDRLRIDLGSADGIEKGDVLAVQDRVDWRNPRYLRVQSVQERSCITTEADGEKQEQRLEAGRHVVMQRDLGSGKDKPSDGGTHRFLIAPDPSRPVPDRP